MNVAKVRRELSGYRARLVTIDSRLGSAQSYAEKVELWRERDSVTCAITVCELQLDGRLTWRGEIAGKATGFRLM